MMIDNPPAIIFPVGEITPEQHALIGCAGLWADYYDMLPRGGDEGKNMEVYNGYITRCLRGEPVAMRLKERK